ncbi:apolipoprotein D [Aethina tumida]|uniref:apolipoprotein D n=1 Tax=Aethina tumida TaxID=116153 RepID=UPI00096B6454|nr:apolipoprotein D [Aethina tumida]
MVCTRKSIGSLILFAVAQIAIGNGIGPCPKIKYLDNFNISRITGHWNEIERSFYLMELISSCVTMDIYEKAKGSLNVSITTKSRWSGTLSISDGTATSSKRDPSILNYRVTSQLPKAISRFLPGAGTYQVIKTDYDNYMVLYSCTTLAIAHYPIVHVDLAWILGRHKEISAEVRADIYQFLSSYYIDSERLILAQNKDC